MSASNGVLGVKSHGECTQGQAGELIGTSQAQVSKMEAGVSTVTLDRMIKALTALGASRATIVKTLSKAA